MLQRAVVVGAGIGGLCAAAGLRRAGWQVTVLERWPQVVGIGAGLAVWPDAQRCLDVLGVGESFRERAVSFGPASLFTASGRRLCAVPSRRAERRGGAPIRILRRSDLMDMLLDAAGGCDIRTGADVAGHVDLLGHADVVVAADGLGSAVRSLYFQDAAAPRYSGYVGWRGFVPFELGGGQPGGYGETWGDGALFGVTRLGPGATNWYAAVPASPGQTQTFAEATARFRSWREPIPRVLAAADPGQALRHPIYELRPHLRSFVTGKIALIGDAAHAMTPNLGRGACEAILDAARLVECLTAAGAGIAAALAAYDQARRKPAQRAADRSRTALRVATTHRQAPRDLLLRMLSPLIQ
jgi:2-polyprenyl-6-methoxyphenol hydroxylase-like FAD-dependent oxidoreductase